MTNLKRTATCAAAAAVIAFSAAGLSGCADKKHDPYDKKFKKPPSKHIEKEIPPPPTDFFPLKINFSWKYYLWACPACPKKSINVLLTGIKEVAGEKVYILNNGNTGYVEKPDAVYLVLINKGKLVNLGVAGKHDLKTGDTWDITLNSKSKVTKQPAPEKTGKKGSWKIEIAEQGEKKKSVCGIQHLIGLPSDEPSKTYFNAICCTVAEKTGNVIKREHVACYAPGVGLVAEYFTDAKSEIAGFSANPPAPPKK